MVQSLLIMIIHSNPKGILVLFSILIIPSRKSVTTLVFLLKAIWKEIQNLKEDFPMDFIIHYILSLLMLTLVGQVLILQTLISMMPLIMIQGVVMPKWQRLRCMAGREQVLFAQFFLPMKVISHLLVLARRLKAHVGKGTNLLGYHPPQSVNVIKHGERSLTLVSRSRVPFQV
eukprot:Lithocolla_globosa_v1_NODE_173_length_5457_cov_128.572381.p2 type:complete len:173 gc:universal NODE_173_length_5457_cov_128.572381:3250-2732(-)